MDSLQKILANKRDCYRIYYVPKPNGKRRKITEPIGDIIHWQELAKTWFDTFPLHDAAHGFRKGRSPITNAMPHRHLDKDEKWYVLNIDLKDFFPSVTSYMVYQMLQGVSEDVWKSLPVQLMEAVGEETSPTIAAGDPIPALHWEAVAAEVLTSLCTLDGALPQGACTSPALANIVFTPLDFELRRLADSQGLNYTRYADDLSFSGKEIPKWFTGRIRELMEQASFRVNKRKVKLTPYFQRMTVTGIVVNNETLGVSKKVRNALRQHLHFLGLRGKSIDDSSQGLLEYIRSIKQSQYDSLMRTYEGEHARSGETDSGRAGEVGVDNDRLPQQSL